LSNTISILPIEQGEFDWRSSGGDTVLGGKMDLTSIVIWIIIGAVAGWLADAVVGGIGVGLIGAIIVGIIGAFIGGWLFSLLGISIGGGIIGTIITAFIGAVILLLIVRALRGRRAV
jgi:uncharacterized membrane protein YeaQ/YmgE (transglycosylase-associated protein family)